MPIIHPLLCKDKKAVYAYFKVSRYCLMALHGSNSWEMLAHSCGNVTWAIIQPHGMPALTLHQSALDGS